MRKEDGDEKGQLSFGIDRLLDEQRSFVTTSVPDSPISKSHKTDPLKTRSGIRSKKPRTSFTKAQVALLEQRFAEQKYLASSERTALAHSLDMTDAQVKTWFQNRRTKWRSIRQFVIEMVAGGKKPKSVNSKRKPFSSSNASSPDPISISNF